MSADEAALATSLCGIALRNPVIAASGTFAYGIEFEKLLDLNSLGGLVVKGLSLEPIEGKLPTQARDLVKQAHTQAREVRQQLRKLIHQAAA